MLYGLADLIEDGLCDFGCHFYDIPPAPIDYIDMDFRIVNMRTITILMASICLSCNVCKNNKFEYTQDTKQLWVSSYKYEAFYGCINEGLQNDSLRIILKNRDLFNPHKTMDFSDIDQARLLGRNIIINAPAPYIKIDQGEENLLKKQYVSDICLRYYASSELNSIAEQAYRAHHNTK